MGPRLPIRLNECLDTLDEDGGEVVFRLTMDIASKRWTAQNIDFEPLPVIKDIYSFTVKNAALDKYCEQHLRKHKELIIQPRNECVCQREKSLCDVIFLCVRLDGVQRAIAALVSIE